MQQTLRRPANWQDFETLCKKLWGEIWRCPEIQKNGRSGQIQHGVDIYGIPGGGDSYYGIQCKGKNEYAHQVFTEKEIRQEIEKALQFTPALKKFYFATTAVKDANIEAFIRQLNMQHRSQGLFEIYLYAWEDIVDLIDENRHTHDWYQNGQQYKAQKALTVRFPGGLSTITCAPLFKKTTTHFQQAFIPAREQDDPFIVLSLADDATPDYSGYRESLSYCCIQILLHNTGTVALENIHLDIQCEGQVLDLNDNNAPGGMPLVPVNAQDLTIRDGAASLEIFPVRDVLVPGATYTCSAFYIKPDPLEKQVRLHWKLFSRDYRDAGSLQINLETEVVHSHKTELTQDYLKAGKSEEGAIEEVLIP